MIHSVEFFLALRYLRPKRNFVSIITILSLLGVMFGVGVLIVVLSVMEGFEQDFQKRLIGFTSHVRVTNNWMVDHVGAIESRLREVEEVKGVAPYVRGPIIAEYNSRVTTPILWGSNWTDTNAGHQLNPDHLMAGEWFFGPDAVVVGNIWAQKNNAWVGDKVLIHSPKNIDRLKSLSRPQEDNAVPPSFYLPQEFTIVGVFSSGLGDYDANFFLLHLDVVQQLYSLGTGVHGISLKLEDPMRADLLKPEITEKAGPGLGIYTWMDDNRTILSSVAVEQRLMFFVLFFVILVAAFGLCSTLITVTVQKSKEIGLMKAIGATEEQIVSVFTLYGFIVGVVGSTLGVTAAWVVLINRNELSNLLAKLFGVEIFPVEVYRLTELPAVLDGSLNITIALVGVGLSTLAALIPAISASSLDPVKALHGE